MDALMRFSWLADSALEWTIIPGLLCTSHAHVLLKARNIVPCGFIFSALNDTVQGIFYSCF